MELGIYRAGQHGHAAREAFARASAAGCGADDCCAVYRVAGLAGAE